jgi:predicted dehydrogenase
MNQIRTVVIGFGGMGSQYAEFIHSGKVEGMILTGICCRNAAGQAKIRECYPDVAIYKDADDTFAHADDFDAVVIVTPHTTHVEIGKKAFAHGKHILCDKPAGVTTKEVRELLALQPEGVTYAMMFNTRMEDAFLKAKEILDNGQLGELNRAIWVVNNWFRSPAYHHSAPWRSSWEGERGGLLLNQCQHNFDMWQWLLGMPTTIDADMDFGRYNDFAVDDAADIRLLYGKDSAHPGLHGNFISATGEHPGVNRFEIWGKKGMMTITNEKVLTLDLSEVDTDTFNRENTGIYAQPAHHCETIVDAAPGKQYVRVFQNFSDHLRKGTPLLAPGTNGINSLILANASYLSAWTGRKITLPMDDELYAKMLEEKISEEKAAKNR